MKFTACIEKTSWCWVRFVHEGNSDFCREDEEHCFSIMVLWKRLKREGGRKRRIARVRV